MIFFRNLTILFAMPVLKKLLSSFYFNTIGVNENYRKTKLLYLDSSFQPVLIQSVSIHKQREAVSAHLSS